TLADAELARAITRASLPWKSWRISLTDGTELFSIRLEEIAENAGWRIRWSELYRVLREAAGASVHYGCEITAICRASSDSRKTKVTWRQDNGTTGQIDDIDLLIGGDGRYSLVRRIISGEPKVRQ